MTRKRPARSAAAVLAAVLVVASLPLQAGGTPESSSDDWRLNGSFLRRAGAEIGGVLTSPARWGSGDFAVLAAVAGAGALLFAFDREIYDGIQEARTDASSDASSVISKFGDGGYLAGLMAALYLGGSIFDETTLRKTALLSAESFLAASAFVWAGKIVLGRSRPYAGEGSARFRPFSLENSRHSLPSGDAAVAFAVASVIAGESGSFWVDAAAYGLAGLAAVWRVHDRKHWPSDVFIGSAMGIAVGRKIVSLHRRDGDAVRISIDAGPNRRALTLRFSF